MSLDDIKRGLKSHPPPGFEAFQSEESLRAAYRSQVEGEVVDALLADRTGCVVVLLSANEFTQCGTCSADKSSCTIQENSFLDDQLKVCHLPSSCTALMATLQHTTSPFSSHFGAFITSK